MQFSSAKKQRYMDTHNCFVQPTPEGRAKASLKSKRQKNFCRLAEAEVLCTPRGGRFDRQLHPCKRASSAILPRARKLAASRHSPTAFEPILCGRLKGEKVSSASTELKLCLPSLFAPAYTLAVALSASSLPDNDLFKA